MRVSAILVALAGVAASRATVAPRKYVPRAVEVGVAARATCVAVRVVVTRVGELLRRIVPARVVTCGVAVRDTMFRVIAPRPVSLLERKTVVDRDCVGGVEDFARNVVLVPSRTAAMAVVQAKKPRIVPKIRIFFISRESVAKFIKPGQVNFYIYLG